jgi:hypothetical protein
MLLALDSADPPAEHDGMYPRGALLAANASVPILWLSLFDADGLVTWPGIHRSAFTTVIQPTSDCIERSRARIGAWRRRWPVVFGDMSGRWLSYLPAVERAYLAVWAEEISWMEGDENWAAELRGYLSCLDDPESAGFRQALAQSALYPSRRRTFGGLVRRDSTPDLLIRSYRTCARLLGSGRSERPQTSTVVLVRLCLLRYFAAVRTIRCQRKPNSDQLAELES